MQQTGLPIFLNNSPSVICEQILWLVKKSNLNFSLQETAFSLNLCIKKRFINKWPSTEHSNTPQTNTVLPQEFLVELEAKDKRIAELENIVKVKEEVKEEGSANKIKAVNEEKRALQVKHEKVCADNKITKAENEALKKDLNSVNVALKTSRKENNDSSHRQDRKIELLEDKIKELHEYKIDKESEEKDLKNKTKKLDKKLKSIQEREAKIEIDKKKLERSKSRNNNSMHIEPEDPKLNAQNESVAGASTEKSKPENLSQEPRAEESEIVQKALECPLCECFFEEANIREHKMRKHEGMNFNCKLCDKTFTSEEDLLFHRSREGHRDLSKEVANNFMLKIGKNCNCNMSETKLNTSYNFCQDKDHFEQFKSIWTLLKWQHASNLS